MAGFDRRAATLRDQRQGRERHPVNGNDVSGAASAPGASSIDGDIWQSPSRPALRRLASIGRRLFARIAASLERWRERSRGRQHLRALSDHMLKDLGLLRADVENETANTFWRD
jgi:uncharacterized protein YjiS (DUF1127 family)